MKLFQLALAVVMISGLGLAGLTAAPVVSSTDTESELGSENSSNSLDTAIGANNAFAIDLGSLLRVTGKEWVFSPCSIFQALGMAHAGARGETADQIARAMHCEDETGQLRVDKLHEGMSLAVEGMIADSRDHGYELSIVNAVWRQKKQGLRRDFRKVLNQHYDAGRYEADFKSNPDSVLLGMNTWLTKTAGGKIENFLKPGLFETTTQSVLVSAVHMKIPSAFLTEVADKGAKADQRNEAIEELAMSGDPDTLSLIMFLTAQAYDDKVSEKEDDPALAKWTPVFSNRSQDSSSNDGELETHLDLQGLLEQLKVVRPFTNNADFSGISGSNTTTLSQVIHGAWVRRKADGTFEALAVTMIVFDDGATQNGPIQLSLLN